MNWTGFLQFDWVTPDWVQLEWTHPGWALLALQPLLMEFLLKLRRDQVRHYADAKLLPWVLREAVNRQHERRQLLRHFAAWLLLAGALAGPRLPLPGDAAQQARPQHALDVMVLLDVSSSMYAQDVSPQRLQRAKLELLDLLPRLHGERLGLIAFSGSAGLIMPPNRDEAAFRHFLSLADPGLFEAQGTALASALDLALRSFPEDATPHRAILLLSDAETSALSGPGGEAVWAMADKLKQARVPLYILGVGSEQGATVTLPDGGHLVSEGEEVVSRMDADGFADLARKTDGKFIKVADGDGDWQALYDNGLATLPGGAPLREQIVAWHALYGWLLAPALGLLAWPYLKKYNIFKRFFVSSVVLLIAIGHAAESRADEAAAYAAYQANQLARAQALYAQVPGYAARMGEGAAAYRRQDYLYALKQFTVALLQASSLTQREQALFNIGNSYYMAGNYRAAAESFFGVLHYRQDNADARANLALASVRLQAQNMQNAHNNGMLGRHGMQKGGRLDESAGDEPLPQENKQKDNVPGMGSELPEADKARLLSNERAAAGTVNDSDPDAAYRAALKKLEMEEDNPLDLYRMLIRMEATRNYVPQAEMVPW